MSPHASVPIPLEIDDVQRVRASAGEIRLRIGGRWLVGHAPTNAEEALLVVQIEGRRHRFPPAFDPQQPAAGRWTATFVIPGWAEPRRDGQAALWIGEAVIPLPWLGVSHSRAGASFSALGSAVPADDLVAEPPLAPESTVPQWHGSESPDPQSHGPETLTAEAPAAAPAPTGAGTAQDAGSPAVPGGETPRSGPLADMLLKETVAALHGELGARSSEAARLRGALSAAQSELKARSDSHGELEGTLGELGAELHRLTEAVAQQRAELERRAGEAEAERAEFATQRAEFETERADFASQRAELERRLAELADARESHARELAAAREEHAAALAAAREAQASALAGVREEHAAELRDLHEQRSAAEATVRRRASETAALREELAAAQVAREAARGEAAGLRTELERLGGELAATRERVQSESGDLGQANRLLADARALSEQLRDRPRD